MTVESKHSSLSYSVKGLSLLAAWLLFMLTPTVRRVHGAQETIREVKILRISVIIRTPEETR